ncbi:hypothetical protein [Arthrobacter sp. HLT1-21]
MTTNKMSRIPSTQDRVFLELRRVTPSHRHQRDAAPHPHPAADGGAPSFFSRLALAPVGSSR